MEKQYRVGVYYELMKDNTPERFRQALAAVKERLARRKRGPKILNINAWNEWTEGRYLEPDTVNGMGYLEAIRTVYGTANIE